MSYSGPFPSKRLKKLNLWRRKSVEWCSFSTWIGKSCFEILFQRYCSVFCTLNWRVNNYVSCQGLRKNRRNESTRNNYSCTDVINQSPKLVNPIWSILTSCFTFLKMNYKLNEIKSVLKAVSFFFKQPLATFKHNKIDGSQQRQPGRAS